MDLIVSGENTGFQKNVYGNLRLITNLSDVSSINQGDIAFILDGSYKGDSLLLAYRAIRSGAVGIVREGGGRTDHGSVAAKELGVPCIRVDTDHGKLRAYEGRPVSLVDDVIYEGEVEFKERELPKNYPGI